MDELKPCPFCGAHNVAGKGISPELRVYSALGVVCHNCHAHGPHFGSPRPRAEWNIRPRESALIAERDAARAALAGLRDAQVTHFCSGCNDLAKERDALSVQVRALQSDMGNYRDENERLAGIVATQADGLEAARADNSMLQAENARLREEVAWIRRVNHFTMERPLPIIAGFTRTEPTGG